METLVERQKFLNDGRCDVVRQISGDHGRSPLRQVSCEHVGGMDVQLPVACKLRFEVRHQPGIDFECVQLVGARKKMACEGSAAGADFYDA